MIDIVAVGNKYDDDDAGSTYSAPPGSCSWISGQVIGGKDKGRGKGKRQGGGIEEE